MVWIPCIFLWVFSLLELYYILSSKMRDVPWSWLNISKLFVTFIIIVLTITDLATAIKYKGTDETTEVHNVDIYMPVIKILTFVSKTFDTSKKSK